MFTNRVDLLQSHVLVSQHYYNNNWIAKINYFIIYRLGLHILELNKFLIVENLNNEGKAGLMNCTKRKVLFFLSS